MSAPLRFAWVFCCVLLTSATLARSQDSQSSARLKDAIRALDLHYSGARTLQADFLERYSESGRETRVESGKVYFSRPGRMRWDYEAPEAKLFVSDGKTLWFYVPADRTATREPVKRSEDWRTPLALLTGKANLSRLCSRVEFANPSATAEGNVILRCWPRGEKAPAGAPSDSAPSGDPMTGSAGSFTQVLLEVNPSSGQLADVRVLEPGDVALDFRFGAWQENRPLPDSLFNFLPPKGVAIVPWLDANQGDAVQ
jgi:outer membrane lipoprotein carrier protein